MADLERSPFYLLHRRVFLFFSLVWLTHGVSYSQITHFTDISPREDAKEFFLEFEFEKAIKILDQTVDRKNLSDSSVQDDLILLAYCYLYNEELTRAKNVFEQLLAFEDLGKSKRIICYAGLFDFYIHIVDLETCASLLDTLGSLITPQKDFATSQFETILLFKKARFMYYTQVTDADEYFLRAMASHAGNDMAHKLMLLKYINYLIGIDQKRALEHIQKLRALNAASGFSDYIQFYTDMNFGVYLYENGEFVESISVFNQISESIGSDNDDEWRRALKLRIYPLIADSYLNVGNYYEAISILNTFLYSIKDTPTFTNDGMSNVFTTLYNVNWALGNYKIALEYLDKLAEYGLNSQQEAARFKSIYDKGILYWELSKYDLAIEKFDQLISLAEKRGTYDYYYSGSMYYKALSLMKFGLYEEALNYTEQVIQFQKERYNRWDYGLIYAYDTQANILLTIARLDEARAVFDRYNPLLTDTILLDNYYNLRYETQYIRYLKLTKQYLKCIEEVDRINRIHGGALLEGKIKKHSTYAQLVDINLYKIAALLDQYHQGGERSILMRADESLKQILRLTESSRNSFKSQSDQLRLDESYSQIFPKAVFVKNELFERTGEVSYLSEFMEIMEMSKSYSLSQSLNRNFAIDQTNIPDSLQLQISSLKRQASYLNTQVNVLEGKEGLSELDSTKLSDFKLVLLENKVAFNDLMLHLEQTYPNYYEINYNPQIATVQTVKDNLKPNEALLEYFVGDDGVYVFTISQDTAQVFKLDTIGDERIKRFQEMIQPESYVADQKAAYQGYVDESFALYKDLLEAPMAFLEGRSINKLFIVPDKYLNYLPFELLITDRPETDKLSYKKLNYLLKDYTISYGYSASILFRDNPMSKDRPYKGNMLAVAPSYTQILSDTAELAKLGKFRDGFAELKYNKEEVDGIESYFDGEVLKGDQATEEAFTEQFQNYDILHLAMHALVDNDDSDKSKLVFTPQKDSIYDSYLHNFELYNLNMNPKMAVLSACNTGFGSLASGEGVMSLARAFTYAGAESVVMSHWRVDDQASSTIMQSFYKYLAAGKQKDEALRLAKLDYLETAPATAQHPFHWNNFVVLGDVSSLEVPFVWYKVWWVYLLAVLVLVLPLVLYRQKRTRSPY